MRFLASERTRAVLEAAVWLAAIGALWVYSYHFDITLPHYRFGPVAWPRAILLLALACVAMMLATRLWCGVGRPIGAEGAAAGEVNPGAELGKWQVWATFLLPLGYLWLLPRAGFFATTPFFLAGYMYLFGQRRARHLVGTTLVVYAGLLVVFSRLLFVPLPTGNWPGFYDFSNAVLGLLRVF